MTSPDIKPATFLLVVHCLNKLRVPPRKQHTVKLSQFHFFFFFFFVISFSISRIGPLDNSDFYSSSLKLKEQVKISVVAVEEKFRI
jgi:hypothetical protein